MRKINYATDRQELPRQDMQQIHSYQLTGEFSPSPSRLALNSRRKKEKPVPEDKVFKQDFTSDIGLLAAGHVLSKIKKEKLVLEFIQKLKRNIVRSVDPEDAHNFKFEAYIPQEEDSKELALFGNPTFNDGYYIFRFFNELILFLVASIFISFQDTESLGTWLTGFKGILALAICLELGDSGKRIRDKNINMGKYLCTEIRKRSKSISMLILMIASLFFHRSETLEISLIFIYLYGIIHLLGKLQSIENYIVLESSFSRYWQLSKIFLLNFFIAHCLSIILNSMAHLSSIQNTTWHDLKDLDGAPFIQKYIWGYYWGTTIMLTVGFGDLSANNHYQAVGLILIQTVACIILAYNISEVSKIIQNMHELDNEKNHKLKVFHTISKKYAMSEQLYGSIKNHIVQSTKMKQDLNLAQEAKIIEQLPEKLQNQVKKEINQSIFRNSYFFKDLTVKCQQKLAEKINKIVTHPEELILRKGEPWKIFILRTGAVGLHYRRGKSILNGTIIDKTTVKDQQYPKLVSLGFIWGSLALGDIKSLSVSVLALIDKDVLEDLLKKHNCYMFEYYCFMRDRFQNHYENRTEKCSVCKERFHSQITCPQMHYCPLKQLIVCKYLKKEGIQVVGVTKQRQKRRTDYLRMKHFQGDALKEYSKLYNSNTYHHLKTQDEISVAFQRQLTGQRMSFKTNRISSMNGGIGDSIGNQVIDLFKKMDRFQVNLDQMVILLKRGESQTEILETDRPWNYKGYFIKNNPDNLSVLYSGTKQIQFLALWREKMVRRELSNS